MQRTLFLFRFIVVISSFIAFPVHGQNGDSQIDRRDAQEWLKKIQSGAHKLNFSGTFVYQQGSQVRTSRITHVLDGKNELEKLEILDGKPREYLRNNDEVIYYVPEAQTLLIEKRVSQEVFPAILAANPSDLANYYDIHKGTNGRVAGFDCQIIVLEPKDKFRYGYKLWAEKSNGLLLRAQTIDENNEVVEQIAFTHIMIGNISRDRVKPGFPNTGGWHVERTVMSQASLSGWTIKGVPPGFRKIHEVRRLVSDMPGSGAAPSGGHVNQREVTQIVFSDGLAAISVFIEPGNQSRTEGSMQQGAMNIIGKRQGDFWLTIVGEVPAVAIRQVANSIEFTAR